MEDLMINVFVGVFLAALTSLAWFATNTLNRMEGTFERFEMSINRLNNNVIILLEHKRIAEEDKKVLWEQINEMKNDIRRLEHGGSHG